MIEEYGNPQQLAVCLNIPSGPKRFEDSKGICINPIELGPEEKLIRINDYSALRVHGEWPCESWYHCQECRKFFVETCHYTVEFLHLKRAMFLTPSGLPFCHECANMLNKMAETFVDTDEKRAPVEIEVPAAFMTASEADYKGEIRKRMSQWPRKLPLLGIQGIPGSGKTRATWAIAKRMAFDGRRVWHENTGSLKGRWLSLASSDQRKRIEMENALFMTPWLIIDDISSVKATPAWQEFFHQLLEKRTIAQRPTILTMAGGGEEIQEAYGSQIRSRMNLFQWAVLPEIDWRLKRLPPPEEEKPQTLFDSVKPEKKASTAPAETPPENKGPRIGGS